MTQDIAMNANDLTQLSSREQLSALMDGALPPDETRFLLRRLQHDASLAECWERWRLGGEVMRGLAPAQRLPPDFASRVAAALHGSEHGAPVAAPARGYAWWRWGGGAAVAASLAVAALVVGQPALRGVEAPAPVVASAPTPTPANDPASQQRPVVPAPEAQAVVAATALAAVARPTRASSRGGQARGPAASQPRSARVEAAPVAVAVAEAPSVLMPQPDIVTRPWPRSVLPQYASDGLAVGFGDRGSQSYNPFQGQVAIGNLPARTDAAAQPSPGDAAGQPAPASAITPQP